MATEKYAIVFWSITMNNDEEKYARLRHYFWHYLEGRERINVLAGLDLFPKRPDNDLPQTMERLALSIARKQGKLSELWEAVMSYVPENERLENPFEKK